MRNYIDPFNPVSVRLGSIDMNPSIEWALPYTSTFTTDSQGRILLKVTFMGSAVLTVLNLTITSLTDLSSNATESTKSLAFPYT